MKPSRLLLVALFGASFHLPPVAADEALPPVPLIAVLVQSAELGKSERYEEALKLLENRLDQEVGLTDTPTNKVHLQNALANVHCQWAAKLRANPDTREGAIAHYQAAYQSDRTLRRAEAGIELTALGDLYSELSRPQEATESWLLALEIARELKNREQEGALEIVLARAYGDRGEYDSALQHYNLALTIAQERGDTLGAGWAQQSIGGCQLHLGRVEEAATSYHAALSIFQQLNCTDGQKWALEDLALSYMTLENSAMAVKYLNLVLPFFVQAKDRFGEARMRVSLGRSESKLGHFEAAIISFKAALTFYRTELTYDPSRADVEYQIGQAYVAMDQQRQAILHFEAAKKIYADRGVLESLGGTLIGIGHCHDVLGDEQKALQCLDAALEIAHKVNAHGLEIDVTFAMADIHVRQARYELAYGEYQETLNVYRACKSYEAEASILNRMASLCVKKGNWGQALDFSNQALTLTRRLQNRNLEAAALASMMDVYQGQNQIEAAVMFGKQSINIIQSIRRDMKGLDQRDKDSFLDGKAAIYRELIRLLIDDGRIAEADEVLNMLQQQEFLDSVRGDARGLELASNAATYTPTEVPAIGEQDSRIASVVTLTAEKVTLEGVGQRTDEQNKRLAQVNTQLQRAQTNLEGFFAALPKRFNRSARQIEKDRSSLKSIRTLLGHMGGKAAYIWAFVDERGLELLVTMSTGPTVVLSYKPTAKELGGKTFTAWLNTRIHDFNSAISKRRSVAEVQKQARVLYDVIFCRGQLANQLKGTGINTLMWRLTGTLRSVPFPALCDREGYLVKKYAQIMLTAGSSERNLAHVPRVNWRALGAGISQARTVGTLRFDALPAAALELGTVINDPSDGFGGGILPGRVLLNGKFTRDAFFKELQGKTEYQLVHISSHFEAGANPAKSFLLTGDKENALLPMDAFRPTSSSPSPFRGVELVTLSACNTAKSVGTDGVNQGADSLAALVETSGAKAVLATLWPVADKQTAHFMGDFYRLRKTNAKQSKLWALHQAQLKMLHATPHPYYWAPFVLTGNGR